MVNYQGRAQQWKTYEQSAIVVLLQFGFPYPYNGCLTCSREEYAESMSIFYMNKTLLIKQSDV